MRRKTDGCGLMEYNLIVILGPTASGKTRMAARLARELGTEIISADSRQVYRGMDIGTGKDLGEYVVDGRPVPFHLIDVIHPSEEFSVFDYQSQAYRLIISLREKGMIPIMAGGSGLYLDSVIKGYRMPEVPVDIGLRKELDAMDMGNLIRRLRSLRTSFHNITDFTDRERVIRAIEIAQGSLNGERDASARPEILAFIMGIRWDREVLRRRITRRLEERIRAGLIDEVKNLNQAGLSWERMESLGLEYRYAGRYIQREISYDEMIRELNIRIHQFAKRQLSWFRRMERQGAVIHWIEGDDCETARRLVREAFGGVHPIVSPR
jgi:tRNA dimethylallyltransferase